jgi:hypothetical protein
MQRALRVAVILLGSGLSTMAAAQMSAGGSAPSAEEPGLTLPEEMPALALPDDMTNPTTDAPATESTETADPAPGTIGDPYFVSPGGTWQAPYSVEGEETLDPESN